MVAIVQMDSRWGMIKFTPRCLINLHYLFIFNSFLHRSKTTYFGEVRISFDNNRVKTPSKLLMTIILYIYYLFQNNFV